MLLYCAVLYCTVLYCTVNHGPPVNRIPYYLQTMLPTLTQRRRYRQLSARQLAAPAVQRRVLGGGGDGEAKSAGGLRGTGMRVPPGSQEGAAGKRARPAGPPLRLGACAARLAHKLVPAGARLAAQAHTGSCPASRGLGLLARVVLLEVGGKEVDGVCRPLAIQLHHALHQHRHHCTHSAWSKA